MASAFDAEAQAAGIDPALHAALRSLGLYVATERSPITNTLHVSVQLRSMVRGFEITEDALVRDMPQTFMKLCERAGAAVRVRMLQEAIAKSYPFAWPENGEQREALGLWLVEQGEALLASAHATSEVKRDGRDPEPVKLANIIAKQAGALAREIYKTSATRATLTIEVNEVLFHAIAHELSSKLDGIVAQDDFRQGRIRVHPDVIVVRVLSRSR